MSQMTHSSAPHQLTVAMTITRKAQTRTEKESCISLGYKAHLCSQITLDYSSKTIQFPPCYLDSHIYMVVSNQFFLFFCCFFHHIYIWCLHWNWVKLICELRSHFILLPSNKACAVLVSALILLLVA